MLYIITLLFNLFFICSTKAIIRDYHIAAVKIKWDYAPGRINYLNGNHLDVDSHASVFTKQDRNSRIGKVYNKVVYRECVDASCSKTKDNSKYLGLLGPILRAEVGDVIQVHFTNKASRKYSVHPHGVFYKKDSEGALYEDKTSGKDKEDDGVKPNEKYVYTWQVKPEHGPTAHDSDCLTWAYHSHVNPKKDVNTGLIGAMVICKQGTFVNNKHKNIDKDFVIMFHVMDENESWLLAQNVAEYCPDFKGPLPQLQFDDDFRESNKMHVINGYFYGNLPGLDMCVGDVVDWHMFGMGNEVDIHTAYFRGQSVVVDGHRTDVDFMFPAKSSTAHMVAKNPGQWLLNCIVNDHYSAGMSAYFNVSKCANHKTTRTTSKLSGKTREYFIAAEEVLWDYAPSGKDLFNGGDLTDKDSKAHEFFARGNDSIGGKYWKALFREYKDISFNTPAVVDPALGFLGPVIRAEVGDTIKVHFKNKASFNFSIQAHGVFYNKSNEGALYEDNTILKDDDIVQPGHSFTYTWTIPDDVAPTTHDPDCLTYVYTSSVDPIKDVYSGLIGPLLICKSGTLDENGAQKNIDKEFVLMFSVTNENEAWYIEKNAKQFAGPGYTYDASKEGNLMHGINGQLFGNLPNLVMCSNDTVSWHLIGYGNEVDVHGASFYGQTFLSESNRKDSIWLLPGSFRTVLMTPDNIGEWAVVCKTNDHYDAGMVAKFVVEKCSPLVGALTTGKKRTYYIAAVEIDWDYIPTGFNILTGTVATKDSDAKQYAMKGKQRLGHVYKKVVYKQFTDDSFTTEEKQPSYYGLVGPMIKAEVGDVIEVMFKNKASRNYSIHSHGVLYDKSNEGALYMDNTTLKSDDIVQPGHIYTYIWQVPSRAGPTLTDNECLTWMYYSNVDPSKDTNSGLIGPLVICRKGSLDKETSKTKEVDHEFPLYFTLFDENLSWYLDETIARNKDSAEITDKEDWAFQQSNKYSSINGLVFGNLQGMAMKRGEHISWYLMSLGTEVDVHTVHFHGQTVLHRTLTDHREDVINLFPGVFETIKMVPDSTGRWLLHCHVNDHLQFGMETLYDVTDATETPVKTGVPTTPRSSAWILGFNYILLISILLILV